MTSREVSAKFLIKVLILLCNKWSVFVQAAIIYDFVSIPEIVERLLVKWYFDPFWVTKWPFMGVKLLLKILVLNNRGKEGGGAE